MLVDHSWTIYQTLDQFFISGITPVRANRVEPEELSEQRKEELNGKLLKTGRPRYDGSTSLSDFLENQGKTYLTLLGCTSPNEIKHVLPYLHALGAGQECWRTALEEAEGELTIQKAFETLLIKNPDRKTKLMRIPDEDVEICAMRAAAQARAKYPNQPKSLQHQKTLEYLMELL